MKQVSFISNYKCVPFALRATAAHAHFMTLQVTGLYVESTERKGHNNA